MFMRSSWAPAFLASRAGSVVGPDGRWYVFGGITVKDDKFITVAQTEVYDPVWNIWSLMDPSFNLGRVQSMPPRFWPRGAMVGNDLWVVGGSITTENGEEALPVIDRLFIPTQRDKLPIVFGNFSDDFCYRIGGEVGREVRQIAKPGLESFESVSQ